MNGWVIGYLFCALLMLAWVVCPPLKSEQDRAREAFQFVLERHGRTFGAYAWLVFLCIVAALGWPAILLWRVIETAASVEFYE